MADALVDLTGGLAERWNLKDLARTSGQQAGPGGSEHRTCRQLLSLKDRCLISCSVLSPRAGARELGEFHAFVVSDVRELPGRAGQSEGWSRVDPTDGSELLSQLQEGEFWVEEEEFLREFDEVTVGFPITEAGHLQSLYSDKALCHTQELPGAWVRGQSAGGCRNNSGFPSNPKFWLRVSEPSEVFAAVLQRPRVRAAAGAGPGEALPAGEWETVQLRGSWRIGRTAGGSRNFASYPTNPCFPLAVPDGAGPRCVRITLRQHCQDSQCRPIGFHVFQVPVDGGGPGAPCLLLQEPLLSCVPHCYAQEVSRLCHLSAGTYRIVPSTYLPDTEGAFTVTIATRIDRRSIHSRERLGQLLQESSFLAVMKT